MHTIKQKHIAEAFGTFILSLLVALSIKAGGSDAIPTAVLAAATVGIFVYTIGGISGTHLNPAVTLALFVQKKLTQTDALYYVAAQMIGGIIAGAVVHGSKVFTALAKITSFNGTDFVAEIFGTLILMFGIIAVVAGKAHAQASGIVIGGSLLLGATLAGLMGGDGFLNPAVAIAAKQLSLTTILGPGIGAVIAVYFYSMLIEE
ncbi:MAG: Aquaporin [Candidatus Parcubacteria bacterium]|jgi:aquaporin Z